MPRQGHAIGVEIRGVEDLAEKLTMNHTIYPPIRRALESALLTVQADARTFAKPHGGDTGELARTIKYEVGGAAGPLGGKVYTNLDRAVAVEYGRRGGRMPPIQAIAMFLRRHGGDPRRAFVVARAIGRHGTKGVFYFKRAADQARDKIKPFFITAADEIERIWGAK